MLSALAIWYLRVAKKSVLIGYELDNGKVKSLNNTSYIYDYTLNNVDYRDKNDEVFIVPEGKFKEKY